MSNERPTVKRKDCKGSRRNTWRSTYPFSDSMGIARIDSEVERNVQERESTTTFEPNKGVSATQAKGILNFSLIMKGCVKTHAPSLHPLSAA